MRKNLIVTFITLVSIVPFIAYQNMSTFATYGTFNGAFTLSNLQQAHSAVTGVNLNSRLDTQNLSQLCRFGFSWYHTSASILDYISIKDNLSQQPPKPLSENQKLILANFELLKKLQNTEYRQLLCGDDASMIVKTAASLQFNFKEKNLRIPAPGSTLEIKYFKSVLEFLDTYAYNSKIIVIGNEPLNETLLLDQKIQSNKSIPLVSFSKRLAAKIHNHLLKKSKRSQTALLLGSIHRLGENLEKITQRDFLTEDVIRRFLYQVENSQFIDGLSIKTRQTSINAFENFLYNLRSHYQLKKSIVITDHSFVPAFKENLNQPLCKGASATAFCERYFRSKSLTERQYLNQIRVSTNVNIENRVSADEWATYLGSRSYLPKKFFGESHKTLNKYGISMIFLPSGTSKKGAFLPEDYVPLTIESTPFGIDSLYTSHYVKEGSNYQVPSINRLFNTDLYSGNYSIFLDEDGLGQNQDRLDLIEYTNISFPERVEEVPPDKVRIDYDIFTEFDFSE